MSLIGAPATFCKTLAVVRLTSCKQAEPDAALGQMTVKAQARSAASVMAVRQKEGRVRSGVTRSPWRGRKVRINSYKMELLGVRVYLWLYAC